MNKDTKEVEAGTPGYDAYNSPKPDDLELQDEPRELRGASILQLLAIAFPRLAIQMAWSAQWAALGPYLSSMMPKFAVQLTQVIGPATGIIFGPAVGVFSDRSTNKWGRRRPFLVYAGVFSVICYTLMGFTRDIGEALGDEGTGGSGTHRTWTAFFMVIFYAWMDITVNVVQTPLFLMIADFAGDRQTLGASIGQGWSTLGSIMIAGYIEFFGAAHLTLRWFLFMLSVCMVVTIAVACVAAKETPLDPATLPQDRSTMKQVVDAFGAIYTGLRTLPGPLIIYCIVFFCVEYGYTAYNGNKGQFFGLEVYSGNATDADNCDPCSEAQDDYNHGVRIAGGRTDLIFNLVGYAFSWCLPFLVRKFGAKWMLIVALVPQSLLMVMAFCKVVGIDVLIVVLTTMSQTTVFALLVPVVIHVFGDKVEIGMYVGALNSAQCFGQLLNFIIGAALVETSMGYKLPVFIGGVMSFIGVVFGIFFLKIKMYSM
jgi:solute carrier family 45 protein 1/2/4